MTTSGTAGGKTVYTYDNRDRVIDLTYSYKNTAGKDTTKAASTPNCGPRS
ncbi:hypothetical protein [Streptomyces resistomycificus]|nr:hypothetical protein [Streptomyces resistomycificus]